MNQLHSFKKVTARALLSGKTLVFLSFQGFPEEGTCAPAIREIVLNEAASQALTTTKITVEVTKPESKNYFKTPEDTPAKHTEIEKRKIGGGKNHCSYLTVLRTRFHRVLLRLQIFMEHAFKLFVLLLSVVVVVLVSLDALPASGHLTALLEHHIQTTVQSVGTGQPRE